MLYGILLHALSSPLRILQRMERRVQEAQRERQGRRFRAELECTEGYSFTSDWMSDNTPNWLSWLAPFHNRPGVRMLEIGSFEGRSTIWFLENILSDPTAHLTCIDLFRPPCDLRFDHNLRVAGQVNKVTKVQGRSEDILPEVVPSSMDIIYVDGSHRACDVLLDAVLAWRLLKPAGVMIFDDYLWELDFAASQRPQMAIELFLETFTGQYTLLDKGYQVAIRKHEIS
jgi:predicted O-methyltransferase YrrM